MKLKGPSTWKEKGDNCPKSDIPPSLDVSYTATKITRLLRSGDRSCHGTALCYQSADRPSTHDIKTRIRTENRRGAQNGTEAVHLQHGPKGEQD